ncbi:PepSY domain-containing protein [Lacicoccus alkaliphilus]|uniref:Uncharacterized membrane protein YkoI n=1 Tax=Lacicoccus alkaliphilus DSM 16010 TaxID=1123231 RepID=A0A1M7HX46_9BACL|nr:PepSY domain-containing protein [Salinicoccus alkaliphilus]SHM33064.1 Uncharacterized membrane protein YkoI [Salinicoccus alkaliphilus DSM 16010]
MKFYKNTLLAGSLSAALVLGACSTANASDDMEWENADNAGVAIVKTGETSEFKYSVQDAVDMAAERFEGSVTDVELDGDDGEYYYEIEMKNGEDEYDVEINAEDLSIKEEETDREAKSDEVDGAQTDAAEVTDGGYIGMDEAVKIAKDEAGGGEVDEKEFDRDDNEYEIDVLKDGAKYEVEINATTGDVKDVEVGKKEGRHTSDEETVTDSGFIGMDEAVKVAKDKVGGGDVHEKAFDRDDNEYEIDIFYDGSKYEVEINATTGEVKDIDQENESGGNYTNNIKLDGDFISSEEAIEAALEAVGGGTVAEWDLDKEDDEYDIEIDYNGSEYEVEINATTGEVLDVEKDD